MPAEPCAPWHGRRRQERSAYIGREPQPGMLDHENSTARPDFLVTCVWLIIRNPPSSIVESNGQYWPVVRWSGNVARRNEEATYTYSRANSFHRNALASVSYMIFNRLIKDLRLTTDPAVFHIALNIMIVWSERRLGDIFTCHTGTEFFARSSGV